MIITALATFTTLMFVLGVLPFRVPAKVMPMATTALAYGIYVIDHHVPGLVEAAAAAGVVAVVTRFAVSELPEPSWSVDGVTGALLEIRARARSATRHGPVGHRIPSL